MDNHDALLLKQGRARGLPNFRVDEDIKLATGYAVTTTDAAVGTDQDGSTFWDKIRLHFVSSGGSPLRSASSLKNCFNKVHQFEVNKYIDCLQSSLRKYPSGWVMADFVTEAKTQYQLKNGKVFKFEAVYDLLKVLPKYKVDVNNIEAQTRLALMFMDGSSVNHAEDAEKNTEVACLASVTTTSSSTASLLSHAVRPSVGKRKAKTIIAASNSCSTVKIKQEKGGVEGAAEHEAVMCSYHSKKNWQPHVVILSLGFVTCRVWMMSTTTTNTLLKIILIFVR